MPQYSRFTWTAGAPSHAAMHSPVTRSVIRPSGGRLAHLDAQSLLEVARELLGAGEAALMLPQTVMTYLPFGRAVKERVKGAHRLHPRPASSP